MQIHPEIRLHEEKCFPNVEALESWRHELSQLENAQYSVISSTADARTKKRYQTYACRRSCETATYELTEYELGESTDKEIRPCRGKSSCKLEEGCASRFFAIIGKDGVSVRYYFLHTGHNPSDAGEVQHLRLSGFLRRQIMMQLLNRMDEQSIARSINTSLRNRNTRQMDIVVSIISPDLCIRSLTEPFTELYSQ